MPLTTLAPMMKSDRARDALPRGAGAQLVHRAPDVDGDEQAEDGRGQDAEDADDQRLLVRAEVAREFSQVVHESRAGRRSGPPKYKSLRLSFTFTSPPMMRDFRPQSQTRLAPAKNGNGQNHDATAGGSDRISYGVLKRRSERYEGLQASGMSEAACASAFTALKTSRVSCVGRTGS